MLALKESEDKSDVTLRFYESAGAKTNLDFENSFNWQITEELDALENTLDTAAFPQIQPWQIKTLRLSPEL
ncbi:glycosyl hydrolase-related protein [[Leptolyngbya] sp. PCC 7376]|uniref:glycosyl hydrolase-related protein n=1 Tax=[Leptolyngbya] sp. PCC 7376 TaxID=111781 RepID=UPI001CED3978